MHPVFEMLLAVFDRAALMLICLFFLTRTRLFRQLLQKEDHTPLELAAVTAIFSLFALFSTYSGINVEGSLVNVRVIAIMAGDPVWPLGWHHYRHYRRITPLSDRY